MRCINAFALAVLLFDHGYVALAWILAVLAVLRAIVLIGENID